MEHLKEFCTDRQRETIQALIDHKSQRAAANALNVTRSTVQSTFRAVKKKAALAAVAPDVDVNHRTMEGFSAKRVSTAFKENGEIALQWVIQEPDKQSLQQRLNYMLEGIKDDLTGFKKAVKAPAKAVAVTVPELGLYVKSPSASKPLLAPPPPAPSTNVI